MRPILRSAAVLALSAFVAACSATGPQAPVVDPADETPITGYPAYETFDPAGYEADPEVVTAIEHDVPERVMQGRVNVPGQGQAAAPAAAPEEPQARQVDGYRVQVFNTSSRDAAERIRDEAAAWWRGAQSASGMSGDMDLLIAYQQPYYRVRMGAFATREEADRALALVRQRFPDAFLVADLVTVME